MLAVPAVLTVSLATGVVLAPERDRWLLAPEGLRRHLLTVIWVILCSGAAAFMQGVVAEE